MSDSSMKSDADGSKAELFETLSHPVRIKILERLQEGPLGFAELKRRTGLESSGHLQFHLGRLAAFVKTNSDGNYILTDDGKEALRLIAAVGSEKTQPGILRGPFALPKRKFAAILVIVLLLGSIVSYESFTLYGQRSEIANLNSNISSLDENITSLKVAGQTVCNSTSEAFIFFINLLANQTTVLQANIQTDQSLVATLQSTKPSGYEEMIATLNGQIGQDNATINYIQAVLIAQLQSGLSNGNGGPCDAFWP